MDHDAPVATLDNCASEPIHIPGHIQPHGVLLAFAADGKLTYASDNAVELLGTALPGPGQAIGARHFEGQAIVGDAIRDLISSPGSDGSLPQHYEICLGGRGFDLIVHRSGAFFVAEFELAPPGADLPGRFAIKARRGLDKLRRQATIRSLLETAVEEVRALTGFDRVMAYRFGQDGSGDVVAEARRADLTPYLNQRYPASDIPAQARRLYVISTLRLIADVGARPVPVHSRLEHPLDMSHCVLRSVSPIHIEYLTNMGVDASMSVSIVIHGQLWGMLACHHMAPRLVPYAVRMACDVMAQIVAANVQSLAAAEHSRRIEGAAKLRSTLNGLMLRSDASTSALLQVGDELLATFDADAAVIFEDGKVKVHGDIPLQVARSLVDWLVAQPRGAQNHLFARHSLADLPPQLASEVGVWCGFLASSFDEFSGAWLVLLRREQVQTVTWGHRPAKNVVVGPLGARLTPQGSFDVWMESVRGLALPWSAADLEIATSLFDELARTAAMRNAQLSRAKDLMMAVLGHDLRTPLQTINMAAHVIGRSDDSHGQMVQRIQSSSGRMERLISQALDLSRLQNGIGLAFHTSMTELSELVALVVDEVAATHPATVFIKAIEPKVSIPSDPDRVSQLLINLLTNAHHHGTGTGGVRVLLSTEADQADQVRLDVRNGAPPIPPEISDHLFVPFKRHAIDNQRNKGGLGLGLYIAHEIAVGLGGSLTYSYDDAKGEVVFTATLRR